MNTGFRHFDGFIMYMLVVCCAELSLPHQKFKLGSNVYTPSKTKTGKTKKTIYATLNQFYPCSDYLEGPSTGKIGTSTVFNRAVPKIERVSPANWDNPRFQSTLECFTSKLNQFVIANLF